TALPGAPRARSGAEVAAGARAAARHRASSGAAAAALDSALSPRTARPAPEPGLDAGGLLGAALYHDAQVEFPERLALENALDAREHGVDVRTSHRVQRIL